jgi:hypothetical protein
MPASSAPLDPHAVLGAVRAQPSTPEPAASQARRPALTAPAREAIEVLRAGTKDRPLARTKELRDMRSKR